MNISESFEYCFSTLEDPRSSRNQYYTVVEILFATFCALLCGADGWRDIELFCKSKLFLLRQFFDYKYGTPSDDTFRRFFRAVDPDSLQDTFLKLMQSIDVSTDNGVIAIDGKTSRRSYDGDKKALHTVSAFASELRMVLGQVKTNEKSNEITAIPELLELLDISGSVVSIDAMGCQKNIAQKIVDRGGDYILALKGNQSTLHNDIKLFFEDKYLIQSIDTFKETDGGHGRIEERKYSVTDNIEWLCENHDWKNLNSIISVNSLVEKGNKISEETRYYISSLPADSEKIAGCVRSHWSIENSLHWILDMSFNDDQSRIRKGNAPQNMMTMKHLALNCLKQNKKKRESIKLLRKTAGWDDERLKKILTTFFS